ncbi:Leukocyte elastase inhibitor, partial [Nibea albiflora]
RVYIIIISPWPPSATPTQILPVKLFRTLSQADPSGNIFVLAAEPSARPLAMVYLGAKGDTATQMAKVGALVQPGEGVHADFETLNADINFAISVIHPETSQPSLRRKYLHFPPDKIKDLLKPGTDGKKSVQMMYQMKKFPYNYIPEIGPADPGAAVCGQGAQHVHPAA